MDQKVTRMEFLERYNKALEEMFASDTDDNEIYGNDVTIHWNGIYCSVGDGATAYNHIISNIESVEEELDDEDLTKPLPIDDRESIIDQMVVEVNRAILHARETGARETSFPYNNESAHFEEVKRIFEDEGYNVFVNIYARCGGIHYTIAW